MHRYILDKCGKCGIFCSSSVVASCLYQNTNFSTGVNVGSDCTRSRNNIAAESADLHVFTDYGNSFIQQDLNGFAAITTIRLGEQLLNRYWISLQDMVRDVFYKALE